MSDDVAHNIVVEGTILPPGEGVCQTCACAHHTELPHNVQSLYYQYAFYHDNMRWPTWGDAMAHCSQEMKDFWREHLRPFDSVTEESLWAPGELPPGDPDA